MRLPVATALALMLTFPAVAEVEPICRARSADGSTLAGMKKPGGRKALAQIPDGLAVGWTETKTVGGADWLLVHPKEIDWRGEGYVKASDLQCEGKVSRLWDQKNDPEYDDADPEFYCSWPLKPGESGAAIEIFAELDKVTHGHIRAEDMFEVQGQPLPIRLWVDARFEINGEDWLRAMYFDDQNTLGWLPQSAVVCN